MWNGDEVQALFKQCSNWDRWGADDELGTLHFITEGKRVAAAQLVRVGRVISLGADLATRTDTDPNVRHRMWYFGHDRPVTCIDSLEIAPHGFDITHLDAVGHVYFDDRMYNGRTAADNVTSDGMRFGSIHAQRDGIVTRGVLLDVAAARGVAWLDVDQGVTRADLEAAE